MLIVIWRGVIWAVPVFCKLVAGFWPEGESCPSPKINTVKVLPRRSHFFMYARAIDRGHEWHIKGPPAASPNPRLTVHILKSEVSIIETFFNGIDFAEVELRRPGVQTYYRGEFTLIGVDNTGDLSKDLSTIFLTGRGRLKMGWDG